MPRKKKSLKAKTDKTDEEIKADFDGSILWSPESNNGGVSQYQFLKQVVNEKFPVLLMGMAKKPSVDPIVFMALKHDKSSFNYALGEETDEYDLIKYWKKAIRSEDYDVAEYHLKDDCYICETNDKLTAMLKQAIENEEYLLAAEIRDMININNEKIAAEAEAKVKGKSNKKE